MSNDVLLVIGNGFDKAHGMKTDYKDVLNFIWNRLEVNYNANCSTDGAKFITRNIDIEKCSIEEFNKIKETFDSLKASCYEEISLREELKKGFLMLLEIIMRVLLQILQIIHCTLVMFG